MTVSAFNVSIYTCVGIKYMGVVIRGDETDWWQLASMCVFVKLGPCISNYTLHVVQSHYWVLTDVLSWFCV